jgi:hypothetical protein
MGHGVDYLIMVRFGYKMDIDGYWILFMASTFFGVLIFKLDRKK